MIDKEKNIIYTAADIEQYLQGKLTPMQMHAMEKAALDDELLAEALEGYSSIPDSNWQKALAELKHNFVNTEHQAKVIVLHKSPYKNWWKVAAAVFLIASSVSIFYLVNNKKENLQIAQTVPAEITKDTTTAISNNTQIIPEKNSIENKLTEADKKLKQVYISNEATAATITETIKPDSIFIYKPGINPLTATEKTYSRDDLESVGDKNIPAAQPNTANAAPTATANNSIQSIENFNRNGVTKNEEAFKNSSAADKQILQKKKEAQLNRFFSAQVVTADNTPLPFANISVKKENFGTYADVNGNFRLVSNDSIITVEVKAAGYQPQFYTLQSFVQQNKITLKEEDFSQRQQTVIKDMAGRKSQPSRRATVVKDAVVNVEPSDGWDNYNTYVNNNIEIPDDILKNNIHGQVELSFDVKPNGAITNIRVDKSLCGDCDEAARRLIEQGPQWKTKNGKKGKGRVTVQF